MRRSRHRRRALNLAAALAIAAAPAPALAQAQPPGAFWTGDICQRQERAVGARGGILGAVLGSLFGWLVAGPSHQTVGGGAGAVQCLAYPPRVETHEPNCRWVQAAYAGAAHQFEACRGPDGVWRPSGRS